MECSNCHSELVPDAKFCRVCGTPVTDAARLVESPVQSEQPTAMPQVRGPAPVQPQMASPVQMAPVAVQQAAPGANFFAFDKFLAPRIASATFILTIVISVAIALLGIVNTLDTPEYSAAAASSGSDKLLAILVYMGGAAMTILWSRLIIEGVLALVGRARN